MLRELNELMQWYRRFRKVTRLTEGFDDEQSPDIYIARVGAGGIPASSDVGTGSVAVGTDVPGSADCDIYRVDYDGTFSKVTDVRKTVYNVYPTAIAEHTWAIVARDKFGNWLALSCLSEASLTVVTDVSFDTGTCVLTKTQVTYTIRGMGLSIT